MSNRSTCFAVLRLLIRSLYGHKCVRHHKHNYRSITTPVFYGYIGIYNDEERETENRGAGNDMEHYISDLTSSLHGTLHACLLI